tara:strand:+ start:6478 stop:6666 length:189 start_codon:yes stop_codon:yes gene_type:complete
MPESDAQKRSDMSLGDLMSRISNLRKRELLSSRMAIKDDLEESAMMDYDMIQEQRRERSSDA